MAWAHLSDKADGPDPMWKVGQPLSLSHPLTPSLKRRNPPRTHTRTACFLTSFSRNLNILRKQHLVDVEYLDG